MKPQKLLKNNIMALSGYEKIMKSKKENSLFFILTLILGLTPILWFKRGMLIISNDMRLPYSYEKWSQLFYVWNEQLGAGAERILDTCLIIFQALPALLQKYGLDIITTEKISFIFWFMLSGIAMYYMVNKLIRTKYSHIAAFSAASFYLYNLWQIGIWVAFKPPLISGYAILPFILTVIIVAIRKDKYTFKNLGLISLLCLFIGAAGNNPSEMIAVISPIMFCFVFFLLKQLYLKDFKRLKRTLLFFVSFLIAALIINLYWLLPEAISLIRSSDSSFFVSKKVEAFLWLKGISTHTSFFNVIRLQGDWTWYDGCVDPYQAYSKLFQTNILLIILSWFAPLMVLFAMFFSKNKYKLLFSLLAITGVVLSMGAHFPFSSTYLWVVKNVPLLWIIRSPYFKFGIIICISFSFLMGLASKSIFTYLLNKFKARGSWLAYTTVFLIVLLNITYAYPVFSGKMFHEKSDRTFLPPNHIEIPDYVNESAEWLNDQSDYFRIYNMPGDSPWISSWGYNGYGSIINNFISKPVVFSYDPEYILMSQGAVNMSRPMCDIIKLAIFNRVTPNVYKLFNLFNIGYILQENDVRNDFYKGPTFFLGDDPEFIKDALQYQNNINFERRFGMWDFYKVKPLLDHIYTRNKASIIMGGHQALVSICDTDIVDNQVLIFSEDNQDLDFYNKISNENMVGSLVTFYSSNDAQTTSDDLQTADYDNCDWYAFMDTRELNAKIVDSRQLSETANDDKLQYTFEDGYYPQEETIAAKSGWKLLQNNRARHIVIQNSNSLPSETNLFLQAYAFGRERDLYVYINDALVSVYNLKQEVVTKVLLKKIKLHPGENIISFYQVDYADIVNGQAVSIAINKNIKLGNLFYQTVFYKPSEGPYDIHLYPISTNFIDFKEINVIINKQEQKLKAQNIDGRLSFVKQLNAVKGVVELTVNQIQDEDYLIEIHGKGLNQHIEQNPEIIFSKVNPTEYYVKVVAKKPFFLIFSESFHPGWCAYAEGQDLKSHFVANSFANGWYVEKIGSYQIDIKFQPQVYFKVSLFVSAGFSIICFIFLLIKRKVW